MFVFSIHSSGCFGCSVSYQNRASDRSVLVTVFLTEGSLIHTAAAATATAGLQVAVRQLSCIVTSLSWHPQNNALLVGGSDGGVGVWSAPVPEVRGDYIRHF